MELFKRAIAGNDIVCVLRIRPFTYMMLSEFFSQLAFNMQHFVLIFIIYALTHSNTAVSGLILSFTIPAILFSVITGVYVDRWSKKKVLFFTNLMRGALLLPFLIPNLHIGFIYTLTFLIAVATQFFLPAESAIIPTLVPHKLILSANAIFALGIYGTILAGYILSGPLLLLLGKTYTIVVLSVLFFISTFFVVGIKPLARKPDNNTRLDPTTLDLSIVREIKEVFSFIKRAKKVMHALIVLTVAESIIFMFAVLGPGYVAEVLDVAIESLSLILIAPAALGMIFGAFLLGSIGRRFRAKSLSVLGFLVSGLAFVAFPAGSKLTSYGFVSLVNSYLPHLLNITAMHIIVVLAFIVGLAISFIFVPSNATIQIETNEAMRGRVYGFLNALIGAVSFLPVGAVGGLADVLGVETVITSIGSIMVFVSLVFLL
ncbi:MAG: MFS transporter [Patescibacteria group bacterium]